MIPFHYCKDGITENYSSTCYVFYIFSRKKYKVEFNIYGELIDAIYNSHYVIYENHFTDIHGLRLMMRRLGLNDLF